MADTDVFERRLRAALGRHVADGPTEVDALEFARAVAAREPRRRGLLAGRTWRGRAIPRTAWILLVLAALLAATVAGALFVGAQLQRTLPAVLPPVGQVDECPPGSNPDQPGPVDQARPIPNAQTAIAFDRRASKLVVVAGSTPESGTTDPGPGTTAPETWTFDVCTNTWTRMHPRQEPAGVDEWDLLVYDVDSDVTIAVDRHDGSVWAYDLQADTWTREGSGPIDARLGAYDPVSGLVVVAAADPFAIWTYDVETDALTGVPVRGEAPADASLGALAYDASVDRLVAYGDHAYGAPPYSTSLFDIRTGTWSRSGAENPGVVGWLTSPTMAYDEAAKRTAVFQRIPLTAFDATADRWMLVPEADAGWPYPGWPYPGWMVYDPVNRRLVGMSQWRGTPDVDIPPGGVEALDLMSGKRTLLLAPPEQ